MRIKSENYWVLGHVAAVAATAATQQSADMVNWGGKCEPMK